MRSFTHDPRPLFGETRFPGDKSISHRAVLFAAMAEGVTPVAGVLDSDDVRATVGAVRALGAQVTLIPDAMGTLSGYVHGWGEAGPSQPYGPIDCGNSGTTARLLMGVLAGAGIEATLVGDESLSRRPMRRVTDPLSRMGARIDLAAGDTLPAIIKPVTALNGQEFVLEVASAQVKSAILLAGISAQGETIVTEPSASRNHTELLLPAFGVPVARDGLSSSVSGPTVLSSTELRVPGDPSSAAFVATAAALTLGSSVMLRDISLNPTRTGFLVAMERMGARVEYLQSDSAGSEPFGTVRVTYAPELSGCVIEPDEVASLIDEVPILALLATGCATPSRFREVGELRVKESDRLSSIIEGLNALGCDLHAEGDDLVVNPGLPRRHATLDSKHDHRLAMTWAIAGMVGDGVDVTGFESVAVSFPGFLATLEKLRG